jgi:UDP-N-acetylglucosamine--N-acetylmuramyl-(pentapeptide) pyrophosphoryl-undecaprenol N-acetylglucosamine transferase
LRPVVIAAGGTGGHFFPAEALASELLRRGLRIALMTDSRSGGLSSQVFAGSERFVLKGAGIAGRGVGRAVSAVGSLAMGTMQARSIFARLNAGVVVGFGGYPCVAPVLASRLVGKRPPVILHEQNAVLGRANRMLSRFADRLALSHAATASVPQGIETIVCGNPVRDAVRALSGCAYFAPNDDIRLLVLGGSLGARVFSDVVPQALAALPESLRTRLRVTQQCRGEDLERVRAAYAASAIRADLALFCDDVAGLLARAHLVVARAGASTVAELGVAGRPAILVPLPGAIDDHQTANAHALADAGGAWMIPQPEFTSALFAQQLETLLTAPDTLRNAAARAASCGQANASGLLADLVEKIAAREYTR